MNDVAATIASLESWLSRIALLRRYHRPTFLELADAYALTAEDLALAADVDIEYAQKILAGVSIFPMRRADFYRIGDLLDVDFAKAFVMCEVHNHRVMRQRP